MRFNDSDVDKNERPIPEQRIIKIKILENPYKDIKPREKAEIQHEKPDKKKKEKKKPVTKNTNLLSFGDEVEEDEEELIKINKVGDMV